MNVLDIVIETLLIFAFCVSLHLIVSDIKTKERNNKTEELEILKCFTKWCEEHRND